jgi:hypothetical protein
VILVLALFGPIVAPTMAWADADVASEQDKAKAAESKAKGDAAMDALKYEEAILAYSQSYALSKNPAVLYSKGRAHQALGQFPAALADLEAFDNEASVELRGRVPGLKERIADIKNHITALMLVCKVDGARVLVRDKQIGVAPLANAISLASGSAKVEVIAEGYFPYVREVNLPGGGTFTLDVQLVPKATQAILVVRSVVAGSQVVVDGKPAGAVPAEVVVGPGTHAVVVRKEGYEESRVSVVTVAGDNKSVDIDLSKQAAISSRWWFWTGVGVIVVGGAVLTYALLTERKAGSGDFSPGQVSGPLLKF